LKRVLPLPPFDTEYFSGRREIEFGEEVRNLFSLIRELDAMAPGFAETAQDRAGFAVDGTVHANWTDALPQDCEVLIVPRVSGGTI